MRQKFPVGNLSLGGWVAFENFLGGWVAFLKIVNYVGKYGMHAIRDYIPPAKQPNDKTQCHSVLHFTRHYTSINNQRDHTTSISPSERETRMYSSVLFYFQISRNTGIRRAAWLGLQIIFCYVFLVIERHILNKD